MAERIRNRMAERAVSWPAYLRILLLGTLGCLAAIVAFIVVIDPWKALPSSLPIDRPMSNVDQRLLYPMLVRTRSWDSFVFGSSTAMLIDPERLSAGLGGRFANLAFANGQPWEQLEYLRLVLANRAQPRAIMFAMDHHWCSARLIDPSETNAFRFPRWIYAQPSWWNLRHVLNENAFFDAITVVRYHLGRFKPVIRDDGYWVFQGYLLDYDREAAQQRLYGSGPRRPLPPIVPPVPVPESERQHWSFPRLDALEQALTALPASTRLLLATMPVHVTTQMQPGSVEAQREEACKQRTTQIAARHGSFVVDLRFRSAITLADDNYWDPLHYRIHVARQVEDLLISGFQSKRPDDAGLRRIIQAN